MELVQKPAAACGSYVLRGFSRTSVCDVAGACASQIDLCLDIPGGLSAARREVPKISSRRVLESSHESSWEAAKALVPPGSTAAVVLRGL